MSHYSGDVGIGGGLLIVFICILVIIAPPIGFLLALALAFGSK